MAKPRLDKIELKDLRVEEIGDQHKEIIKEFDTANKELKDFLIEDSISNQKMCISRTHLWFYRPKEELVSYVTTLSDAIRVHGTGLGRDFKDLGVPYKTLPALKIGRMCVSKAYEKRGIGTYMTLLAMTQAYNMNRISACRFIVLDAKRETGAVHFYKKVGFKVLKDRIKGTLPMYFDMLHINKFLNLQEKIRQKKP